MGEGRVLTMKSPPKGLDLDRVQRTTFFNRRSLDDWIRNAELAWIDKERKERESHQTCRWCWYARRVTLAGQTFTTSDCEVCGEEMRFPTTNTNPLCIPCAKKLHLCVRCASDLDLADRRKLERGKGKRR